METGFATIEARLDEILSNLPNRPAAWVMRFLVLPFGLRRRGPSDRLTQACAEILLNPSATRDRLTADIFHGIPGDPIARLDRAFALTLAAQPVRERMRRARVDDPKKACAQALISEAEAASLMEAHEAVAAAVAVDDFAPEELTQRGEREHVLAQVQRTAAE
jgi:acyl-CoA dehydrogenase